MIQYNTKNTSFLRMHYILKNMGIRNNAFFLQLYDEDLLDIDPWDEDNLSDLMKLKVNREITRNPYYFFREIVKLPVSDNKIPFELTRATLAIVWSILNDMHSYIVIPRQCYKSYTVAICYTYLIYWGTKNFTAAFFAQNDSLVTQNLSRVKDIREALPKYLNMKSNSDTDNQHSLIYRTSEFSNSIITRAPGMSEDAANNVGRGASTFGQWWDEFAYTPYVSTAYGSAIPAYSTVSKIAERTGSRHHIVITTTAGNTASKIGAWAYEFFKACAPFTEYLYDMCEYDSDGVPLSVNRAEIKDYINNNNQGQHFLRIEYQWYELSKPMDYLDEMKRLMPGLDEFNRGVLNMWSSSQANHPLGQERVEALCKMVADPTKIIMVDKIYVCKFYRDPTLLKSQSHHIVFGMDCSGNTRRDFSTLVGVDVTNSEVVFTLRCNQYSVTRFARAVAYILLYLFPKSILVPERNYVGLPVIEIIAENMGQTRIFKDEKDEKIGVDLKHKLRNIMYGDVLRVSVYEHGSKIHDKTIIDEVAGLITDKNGRIDHKQNGGHDDTLISYLYCRWFIMFSKTKNKYIDNIYFNSRLNNEYLTDRDLEDMAGYSSDREKMNYVIGGGGVIQEMERLSKTRGENTDYISAMLKNSIDTALNTTPDSYSGLHSSDDYINNYAGINGVSEDDIKLDEIAKEYMKDAHEYSENLDKDDPEKITKETEEKRDKSNEPVSQFAINFGW